MESAVDLSVEMAGIKFKSPIIVASSECGSNVSMLKQLTDIKIDGIVTKTFTSAPDFRIRVRPNQFPLNKFGKAYAEGGCLYSLAAPHMEATQTVHDHVSSMADYCRSSSLVLIASFFENLQNADLWINQAKGYVTVDEFKGNAFRYVKIPGKIKSGEKYPYTTPPDCPYLPTIDTEVCTLDGICETTCIYQVFTVDEGQSKVFIDGSKCWSCGFCVGICPAGAIELRDRHQKNRLIWNNKGVANSFYLKEEDQYY